METTIFNRCDTKLGFGPYYSDLSLTYTVLFNLSVVSHGVKI